MLETIRLIFIGDFLDKENLIRFFKLLPVPEIKIAVFIFLTQLIFSWNFILFELEIILPIGYGLYFPGKNLSIFLNFWIYYNTKTNPTIKSF